MTKNSKKETMLTDAMIYSFYPKQGKVVGQSSFVKEKSISKIVMNKRKSASIGLKTMYSIN